MSMTLKLSSKLAVLALVLASGTAFGASPKVNLSLSTNLLGAKNKVGSGMVSYKPSSDSSNSEVVVSDRDFNRFLFPSPATNIWFPGGVPVSKPIYLSGNRAALIQVSSSSKPIQMIVELEDSTVATMYLRPEPITGIVYKVAGSKDNTRARTDQYVTMPDGSKAKAASFGSPSGPDGYPSDDLTILQQMVRGEVPDGFDPVAVPLISRFDKFSVVPMASWSDGTSKKLTVFGLVAVPGKIAVVAPPQFYRPGASVILIDGDSVSDKSSPRLFIIEELANHE